MTTLYISGPMAGHDDYNHPAFHEAADLLRAAGYSVLNPAEYGTEVTVWEDCLRRDLHDVLNADGVAVLTGWENSRGANLEVDVAMRLGMPVEPVVRWLDAAEEE